MKTIKDYLQVSEVCKIIGVCRETLGKWDNKGILVAKRHPANNYRLYRKEDVEDFLKSFHQWPDKAKGYLKIAEASKILGVSRDVLYNWHTKGILVPRRHPSNNYREYKREDLDKFLKSLDQSSPS